jgi:hypothetical protein
VIIPGWLALLIWIGLAACVLLFLHAATKGGDRADEALWRAYGDPVVDEHEPRVCRGPYDWSRRGDL